jgi:hypothetical protein
MFKSAPALPAAMPLIDQFMSYCVAAVELDEMLAQTRFRLVPQWWVSTSAQQALSCSRSRLL